LPGFKRFVRQGINVLVAQTLRIDVRLNVGAASEEVTVNADAPLLRTESSEVSYNIAAKVMNDLPILGIGGTQSGNAGIRNPYAMVNLIPGTAWVPNSKFGKGRNHRVHNDAESLPAARPDRRTPDILISLRETRAKKEAYSGVLIGLYRSGRACDGAGKSSFGRYLAWRVGADGDAP
jgi:hypothetical protein